MRDVLLQFEMPPTTWAYVSSLMTIGIYFKFRRFWSVRNLDLAALIAFAPGLLLVEQGAPEPGYIWLFSVGGFYLVRLLTDPMMVRRPLFEPNLSASGLTFTGVALLLFLATNVVTGQLTREEPLPTPSAGQAAAEEQSGERPGGVHSPETGGGVDLSANPVATPDGGPTTSNTSAGDDAPAGEGAEVFQSGPSADDEPVDEGGPSAAERPAAEDGAGFHQRGPGYRLFYRFASFATKPFVTTDPHDPQEKREALLQAAATRTTAILAHLAVVIGMVLIGYRHFDNLQTGIAAATLYLLLPYTAQMTNHIDHAVPAALLVWAVESYRRPVVAGILLGLAAGVIYYPLFLLPFWCAFYWRRGLVRFAVGVVSVLALLVVFLVFSREPFAVELQQMFGFRNPIDAPMTGFWETHEPIFRLPVLAGFVALCGSLALWPAQKNLGTLLSCSAAVMLGTQFWHAHYGGLFMAWYLPLLVLTTFRPNLEDRVAWTVLNEAHLRWPRLPWPRRR